MKEGMIYERKKTLDEIVSSFKCIMPDNDPWVEKKGGKLIIAGAMAFLHNIKEISGGIFSDLEHSPYLKDVSFSDDGPLVITAKFKESIEGISELEFRIDKDMS